MNTIKTLRLSCCLLYALTSFPLVAGELSIDVVKGTVNGKKLEELTVDSLTDMLGRPTESSEFEGQQVVSYHNSGLLFVFQAGIPSMTIYLTRNSFQYSSARAETYEKFGGRLNKGLNSDWKMKKLLEEFTEFERVKESSCPGGVCASCLRGSNTWLQVRYDQTSGFINNISVAPRRGGRMTDFCPPKQ